MSKELVLFFLKRITGVSTTLFVLFFITFFTLRLAPGGPFDTERAFPAEVRANIEKKYELDRPMWVQFSHWMRDVVHGELKDSFQYFGKPVKEIIVESLPSSILLGVLALFFATGVGIPLGCLAAWKKNQWVDRFVQLIAVSGLSLPSYLLASLLILLFCTYLGWLPPALWEEPKSLILPIVTLSVRPLAILIRMTRTSMIESLHSDYIRTAYSKGLSDSKILFKHALKNSLIPSLTVLGPITANLITGSFLVEIIFQIPGLGKHFVTAVINRDYPLVMGVTLVYGTLLVFCNLCVDLLYHWADPKMRIDA